MCTFHRAILRQIIALTLVVLVATWLQRPGTTSEPIRPTAGAVSVES